MGTYQNRVCKQCGAEYRPTGRKQTFCGKRCHLRHKAENCRYATCHPDRKHKGLGLCAGCHRASIQLRNTRRATCHPDRPHQAKGLCKHCYMKRYAASYSRPEASLARRREASWRNRGLTVTVADYNRLLAEQGGGCAICGRKQVDGRCLAVDHDHETKRVRGLLCDYCNRRLLVPRNTPEILQRAAEYMRRSTVSHLTDTVVWSADEMIGRVIDQISAADYDASKSAALVQSLKRAADGLRSAAPPPPAPPPAPAAAAEPAK